MLKDGKKDPAALTWGLAWGWGSYYPFSRKKE